MSSVVGHAVFTIGVDDDALQRGMSRVNSLMQSHASSVSRLFSGGAFGFGMLTAANTFGNLLADGIQRATSLMTGLVEQGIEFNAEIQQAAAGLSVMLGSMRSANRLLEGIQKYAAITPFETGPLVQASVQLMATKKIAENQLLPVLKKIGDAASGSAKGFGSLPFIIKGITDMLNNGRISAQDMNQLANAGIPAWSMLAEKMGKTTKEVRELSKKGLLGETAVTTLIDALGDRYKGMAVKMSDTYKGLISTIRDNVKIGLGKITKPLFDSRMDILRRVRDLTSSKEFTAGAEKLGKIIGRVMDSIRTIASGPMAQWLMKMGLISAAITTVAGGIAVISVGISALAGVLAPLTVPIVAITTALGTLSAILVSAFQSPYAKTFAASVIGIRNNIVEIVSNIRDGLQPAIKKVGDLYRWAFGDSSIDFGKFLSGVLDRIRSISAAIALYTSDFGVLFEYLKNQIAFTASYLYDQLAYTITQRLPTAFTALYQGAIAGVNELAKHWIKVFSAVAKYIKSIFEAITKSQKIFEDSSKVAAKRAAKGDFRGATTALALGGAAASTSFVGNTQAATNQFNSEITPVTNSVGQAISQAVSNAYKNMPEFKPSERTNRLGKAVEATTEKAKFAQAFNVVKRTAEGLLAKAKAITPKAIGEGIGKFNQEAANKIGDGAKAVLGMFTKDSEDATDKKSKKQDPFVGLAEMHKRIQGALLDPEAKDRKEMVKAAKENVRVGERGAKAAEKTAEFTAKTFQAVRGINTGFGV